MRIPLICYGPRRCTTLSQFRSSSTGLRQIWESAKESHGSVFALLRVEKSSLEVSKVLQQPMFVVLPGCQQISVNILLDTLGY